MHEELRRLGEALCRPDARGPAGPPGPGVRPEESVVALPAGGFGYRMRAAGAEGAVTQKALLPLPNGETLIDRILRQYAAAGFRLFVALVNHEGEAVRAHVGPGERRGVEIRWSFDPDPAGSGRTGALLHAIRTGALPADRTLIVHNADCQVMRYDGCFPLDLLQAHASAVRERAALATLAAVEGTPYPYTGMRVAGGMVAEVEMYPFVPIPTHTGITALSPDAIAEMIENGAASKQNFERDMFPRWAERGRLAAMVIRHDQWIAIDDRKALRLFREAVTRGEA